MHTSHYRVMCVVKGEIQHALWKGCFISCGFNAKKIKISSSYFRGFRSADRWIAIPITTH